MNLLAAYGLLAHGLLCGALASLLPLGRLRQRAALIATAIALLAGIAPVLHAWFGPPSITLLLLALLCLSPRIRPPLNAQSAAFFLAFGALFYLAQWLPDAGWRGVWSYALGYQPRELLIALGVLALVLGWRRQSLWLLILAVDLGVWLSGIFANLWDVLFDPLLLLLCAGILIRQALRRFFSARRR